MPMFLKKQFIENLKITPPPRIKGRTRNWTGDRFSRWIGHVRAFFLAKGVHRFFLQNWTGDQKSGPYFYTYM